MKKIIIMILLAIAFAATAINAQNTDKSTTMRPTQWIDNFIFEATQEVIRTTFADKPVFFTTTMDSATALADSVDFLDGKLIAIIVDTGWTAANITFKGYNEEAGTWHNIYLYDGTELTCTAAASRWIAVKPTDFAGIRYLIARSGTAVTPVNQAYARSIVYVIRRY